MEPALHPPPPPSPPPPPPPPPPVACAPVASSDPASKAVANTIIVLRPVMTFSFQWPEPLVIISRPGHIWSPGSQSLTGNFEGINRSSRSRRASTQASPQWMPTQCADQRAARASMSWSDANALLVPVRHSRIRFPSILNSAPREVVGRQARTSVRNGFYGVGGLSLTLYVVMRSVY